MFRQQDTHPSSNYQLLKITSSNIVAKNHKGLHFSTAEFSKSATIAFAIWGAGETRIKPRKEHGTVVMFAHKYKNSEKLY